MHAVFKDILTLLSFYIRLHFKYYLRSINVRAFFYMKIKEYSLRLPLGVPSHFLRTCFVKMIINVEKTLLNIILLLTLPFLHFNYLL